MANPFENQKGIGTENYEQRMGMLLDWLREKGRLLPEDKDKPNESITLTPYHQYEAEFESEQEGGSQFLKDTRAFYDWLRDNGKLTPEDQEKYMGKVVFTPYRTPENWEAFQKSQKEKGQ